MTQSVPWQERAPTCSDYDADGGNPSPTLYRPLGPQNDRRRIKSLQFAVSRPTRRLASKKPQSRTHSLLDLKTTQPPQRQQDQPSQKDAQILSRPRDWAQSQLHTTTGLQEDRAAHAAPLPGSSPGSSVVNQGPEPNIEVLSQDPSRTYQESSQLSALRHDFASHISFNEDRIDSRNTESDQSLPEPPRQHFVRASHRQSEQPSHYGDDLYVNPSQPHAQRQSAPPYAAQKHQSHQNSLYRDGAPLASRSSAVSAQLSYQNPSADDSWLRKLRSRQAMDAKYYQYCPSGSYPPYATPSFSGPAYFPQPYIGFPDTACSPDIAAKLAEERRQLATAALGHRRHLRGLAVWPRSLPHDEMDAPVKYLAVNARYDDRDSLLLAESSCVGVGLDTPLIDIWNRLVTNRQELQRDSPLSLTDVVEVSSPGRENIRVLSVRQSVGDAFMPLARCYVFVVKPGAGDEYPPALSQEQVANRRRAIALSEVRAVHGTRSDRRNVSFHPRATIINAEDDSDTASHSSNQSYGYYHLDDIT